MQHLFDTLFNRAPIELSFLGGMLNPSVRRAVVEAVSLAYNRGLFDGAVAGALVTLLISQRKQVIVIKGADDVDPRK